MKNKIILVLSGVIVANIVLGKVGGEEDVFETKDVFGSNDAQPIHQETATTNKKAKAEPTITNEELKVQVIPNWWDALYESNGFVIKKGMDQYVIEDGYMSKEDIEKVLVKLRPLYTDKAKKLGKKPIVFKYQRFDLNETPIEETEEFSIESFFMAGFHRNTDEFGKFYNASIKYSKPIVFESVNAIYKDEIEKNYDLSNCKIITYQADITSFEEYLKLKKLGIENLKIPYATIKFKLFSEQNLKAKLELFLKHLEGKSIEKLKKGVELLLGLNLKQKLKNNLGLNKLSKFVLDEKFMEMWEERQLKPNIEKLELKNRLKDKTNGIIKTIENAEKSPITNEKELRKQLHDYVHDNRIEKIEIKELAFTNNYEKETVSIPIEYASCLKLGIGKLYETQLINPKNTEAILFVPKNICMLENVICNTLFCYKLNRDIGKNVSCKTIICQDPWLLLDSLVNCLDKIKNLETVLIGINSKNFDEIKKGVALDEDDKKLIKPLAEKNISLGFYDKEKLSKLLDGYTEYIKDKGIMCLSGYVNVKNKPDELSDEEWKQVLVLKQKVGEIIKKFQSESIKSQEFEEISGHIKSLEIEEK